MECKEGLTFDDVLLKPQRSGVLSRKDVDVSTRISRGIRLNIPLVSANMDTVTEAQMAIVMARAGGLGVIHRFLPIEAQVEKILRVKRAENYTIDNPFVIGPEVSLKEVKREMAKHDIQSFVVTDKNRKLLGILTKRDFLFEKDESKQVSDLMTPRERLIVAAPHSSLEDAEKIFQQHKIEKLPLVTDGDRLVGLITARDVLNRLNPLALRDKKGRLLVGAAVGVKGDYLERAEALVEAGTNILVVDIAHGHLEICLEAVRALKKRFPDVELMAGNVATEEGAQDLVKAGADSIKIGVGPGSICKTRVVTGSGMPQITAIMESKKSTGDIPIIADGGIRTSGDITKALAAGASAVMIGSLFAGTDESPGEVVMWNGRRAKLYRGMASLAAHLDRTKTVQDPEHSNNGEILADFVSEGADQVTVPYRGPVVEVISQLLGGLRSGMSYCGAKNIPELWKKAEFIRITPAGFREGGIHDVEM